ncbi:MAG TPA: Fic family protein [Actinomycetota bacterium]|nr:Fic family protein [Actinomycetota bacterium]
MLHLLSRADRALGRLDGSTSTLPNPDLFVSMYVRREAALSSQIEGTQASLIDLLEYESEAAEPERPVDVEEVVNYVAAMNLGLELLRELPVSLRLVRRIHERLMTGVRGSNRSPGSFRRTQNWIGPPGCTLKTATYVPPPVDEMKAALASWERFLHDDRPMPPLIKVGLAHSQFETIHPFLDGNGRIGRLLITFLLVEQGILSRPLLYLSFFFKQHRDVYYERLQAVRDDDAWEEWLEFFLTGVAEVADEATENAHKIVAMREEHRATITEHLGRGAGRALMLLEQLYFRPIVNVTAVMRMTGLSSPRANALVLELEDVGILRETSGRRRNRIFAYDPYVALFRDG